MHRLNSDTLKLGATVAFLGAASLMSWAGLAVAFSGQRLEAAPDWAGLSVIALGNLILTAIVGLLAWVMSDPTAVRRRFDA